MNSPNAVLTVAGLTVTIDGQRILEDVELSLLPGRIHVVVGASGAGKSTLLRTLIGLSKPRTTVTARTFRLSATDPDGGVRLWDLAGASEQDWTTVRASQIGLIFQDPGESLTPLRRAGSLLRETLRNTRRQKPSRARPSVTAELLDAAGLSQHHGVEHQHCFELSGGMAQKLALALAVAGDPVLLLADEPSTALDGVARRTLVEALRARADAGAAVVLVTHDRSLACALADDFTVLQNGRCVESGPASEVLSDPRHSETRKLLAQPTAPEPLRNQVFRDNEVPGQPLSVRPLALRLRGVRHRYTSGGQEVLRGLDLDLADGEFLGLLGRSGSGKSTLIKCLVGLERPSAGRIEIAGPGTGDTSWKALRRSIQLVPQDPRAALNPWRSALEQIMDPLDFHGIGNRKERRVRANELLGRVGLNGYGHSRPGQLSTGQCQRVSIARALAIQPSVVVADEPLTALDAPLRAEMIELLRSLAQASGTALLVVSHELQVLEELCPRIAVLDDGTIVEELQAGLLNEAVTGAAREIVDAHAALHAAGGNITYGKAAV